MRELPKDCIHFLPPSFKLKIEREESEIHARILKNKIRNKYSKNVVPME
jgi:hypothetical protein